MKQCEICGKEDMGKFPIENAKQCECFVQYADRYMKYHRIQLSCGNVPQGYISWARNQEKRAWSDVLHDRNRKKMEHWIIALNEEE